MGCMGCRDHLVVLARRALLLVLIMSLLFFLVLGRLGFARHLGPTWFEREQLCSAEESKVDCLTLQTKSDVSISRSHD